MKIMVKNSEEAVTICRSLVNLVNRFRLLDLDDISFAKTEIFLCGLRDAVEVEKPPAVIDDLKEMVNDFENLPTGFTDDFVDNVYGRLCEIIDKLEDSE